MDAQGLPGAGAPLSARFISGGASNEIFALRRGDALMALRVVVVGLVAALFPSKAPCPEWIRFPMKRAGRRFLMANTI